MRRWCLHARFALPIAFLAVLFGSSGTIIHIGYAWFTTASESNGHIRPYRTLSAEEELRCRSITPTAIIEAAIARYVEVGIAHEKGNQRAENNPWRYTSVADFMDLNPDCCGILARIPDDYSLATQGLGEPHSDPSTHRGKLIRTQPCVFAFSLCSAVIDPS